MSNYLLFFLSHVIENSLTGIRNRNFMEEGSFSLIFPPSFLAFIFISFAQITLLFWVGDTRF